MLAGLLFNTQSLMAREITPLQLLFMLKKAFPEQSQVDVLISRDQLALQKERIARAATQMKIKLMVHVLDTAAEVGGAMKTIADNSAIVVFDSAFLTQKSTKLYVLSKCQEKKVAIVTSSSAYSRSGALVGVYIDDAENVKVALNLKKNLYLKDRFSEQVQKEMGVTDLIM